MSKKEDFYYSLAQEVTGLIPSATSFFKMICPDPANERRKDFAEKIAKKIKSNNKRIDDIENWKKDFEDNRCLLDADNEIKRVIIQNILINKLSSGWDNAFAEAEKFLFMRFYNDFCDIHFKVLKFMEDPMSVLTEKQANSIYCGGLDHVLIMAFPETKNYKDILEFVVNELLKYKLINSGWNCMMSKNGLKANRLTEFGSKFCKFISYNN